MFAEESISAALYVEADCGWEFDPILLELPSAIDGFRYASEWTTGSNGPCMGPSTDLGMALLAPKACFGVPTRVRVVIDWIDSIPWTPPDAGVVKPTP